MTAWKEDPVSGEWRQEVTYVRDPAEVKKHLNPNPNPNPNSYPNPTLTLALASSLTLTLPLTQVKKHKAHEEHLKRKNRQAISAAEEG